MLKIAPDVHSSRMAFVDEHALSGGNLGMAVSSAEAPLLDQNRHQGYFGETFVATIAAAAGLDVLLPRLGQAVDMGVFTPGPRGTSGSRQITLQVKSWSNGRVSADGNFHYPLEVPAYNYLAGANHDVWHYLVLVVVPNDMAQYADAQHTRLNLKRAAYWRSLRDEQPDYSLNEDSTKTVLVPQRNLITPVTIRHLVEHNEMSAVVA